MLGRLIAETNIYKTNNVAELIDFMYTSLIGKSYKVVRYIQKGYESCNILFAYKVHEYRKPTT